ncbi:uncharacterized protein RCC_10635 [Ramularia collo-cygni]|uniref:Heterokaryon incompatibility domain-containing protein n=1 Tax=Ramularia collo-cygni TaxID=112498 RepID=A0A2D3VRE1_9PEZI|nr:uncharacterized protein RCC_10635 [Ramularia collo-cygni]CZT24908.1 uncharacterized protein RCC_10635 [Ramularia collo-cygni]
MVSLSIILCSSCPKVIQEVVCAREIMITCGKATAPWEDFIKLVKVVDSVRHLSAHHALGSKTAAQYIGFMQELRSITEQGTRQAVKDYASEDSMVPYILRMAKDCEASDHRDKLFAFHHLCRLWNKPDYALEIETLYKLFAAQYLQRIAYAITEFSCDEVKLARRQMEFIYSAGRLSQSLDLPSWIPDWSVAWKTRPLWLNSDCYGAGGSEIKEVSPTVEDQVKGDTLFLLPLTVKMFDRVLGAGPEPLELSSSSPHALSESLRTWLFQSMSLLHMHRSRPSRYADQTAAVARVVTVEQDQGRKLDADGASKVYEALLEFLRISDLEESPTCGRLNQDYERFYSSIASFLRGRVFFITEKGSFGLAQAGVAWGDSIVVVQGAPVPVIVRPTINNGPLSREYYLLCESFVLDIMDGELWRDESVPTEEIQLL